MSDSATLGRFFSFSKKCIVQRSFTYLFVGKQGISNTKLWKTIGKLHSDRGQHKEELHGKIQIKGKKVTELAFHDSPP